jgi:hypothetical protein
MALSVSLTASTTASSLASGSSQFQDIEMFGSLGLSHGVGILRNRAGPTWREYLPSAARNRVNNRRRSEDCDFLKAQFKDVVGLSPSEPYTSGANVLPRLGGSGVRCKLSNWHPSLGRNAPRPLDFHRIVPLPFALRIGFLLLPRCRRKKFL